MVQHERKRQRAERGRQRPVGDASRVVHRLQRPRAKRARRIVAGRRLDADHVAGGRERARHERRSREQPAAAAGHQQDVERADVFDQFARGRALAGDDVRVIERRDERQPALLGETPADGDAIFTLAVVDDDLAAVSERRGAFHAGRVGRA